MYLLIFQESNVSRDVITGYRWLDINRIQSTQNQSGIKYNNNNSAENKRK